MRTKEEHPSGAARGGVSTDAWNQRAIRGEIRLVEMNVVPRYEGD